MATKSEIIIALGSNHNQKQNITRAQDFITQLFKNVRFSSLMWTEPIGLDSDKFINCLCIAYTYHPRNMIEKALKQIERKCGRTKSDKANGIISIDIDLLKFGDEKLHDKDWERSYIKELMSEF